MAGLAVAAVAILGGAIGLATLLPDGWGKGLIALATVIVIGAAMNPWGRP